jgi:hypothetical protein
LGLPVKPRQYLAAIIAEIGRRDRLRALVAEAGFIKDDKAWIERSLVTLAVAEALDVSPSRYLGGELRALLKEDGWRERLSHGIWQWRARRER